MKGEIEMVSFDLSGKVAVITGASSGLGEQFAKAVAEQGAAVAVLARRKERLEKLADELKEKGTDCLPVVCDVTSEESIKEAVKEVINHFGKIDILVNNAGISSFSTGLDDHTTEQWDRVLDTNLKGIFLLSREVSKYMIKEKYGKIINISSVGGIQAGPAEPSYHAAKSGVIGLTKAMAADLAPYNVTVNAIAPGVFHTEINDAVFDTEAVQAFKNRVPYKRFGKAGELDGALIYFASDASSYTNAQVLVIDGGMTEML